MTFLNNYDLLRLLWDYLLKVSTYKNQTNNHNRKNNCKKHNIQWIFLHQRSNCLRHGLFLGLNLYEQCFIYTYLDETNNSSSQLCSFFLSHSENNVHHTCYGCSISNNLWELLVAVPCWMQYNKYFPIPLLFTIYFHKSSGEWNTITAKHEKRQKYFLSFMRFLYDN